MKIPPKKPHFFKPILPGFKEKLKIPKGFLKYLKGHSHIERAILKRTGKKWLVKLNGRRLEDGWEKFAGELSLQLGDLVIFRHEGDMEFEVSIFDSSECEREDGAEENNRTPEETSNKFEFKDATGKPKPKITSQCKAFSDLEAAKDMLLGRPHFISTVKPYWMSMSMIHVPKLFARESELSGRKCGIMIRDEERSWPFRLFYRGRHTFIGGEWHLRGDASLRPEGKKIYLDTEIVSTQGKLNASIKSSIKAASHAKAAAHKSDGHSNFVCTIKPYSLTYGFLMERHLYGNSLLLLMNSSEEVSGEREMKMRQADFGLLDLRLRVLECERSTSIHLKAVAGRRVKTPDVAALKLQVPASTSADANPHFISIIKSYSITNSALVNMKQLVMGSTDASGCNVLSLLSTGDFNGEVKPSMASSSSPQPLVVGEPNPNPNPQDSYATLLNPKQQTQILTKTILKPVEYNHGEPTMEEIRPYAIDMQELRKLLPTKLGSPCRCLIGWLARRHILLRFDRYDEYVLSAAKSVNYLLHNGTQHQFRVFPWTQLVSIPEKKLQKLLFGYCFLIYPPELFAKQSLLPVALAAGKPIAVDKAIQEKSRHSTARVKVELDLLAKLPQRMKLQYVDDKSGKITDHFQKFVYDNLPSYCPFCKHQGHDESECRFLLIEKELILAKVNDLGLSENNSEKDIKQINVANRGVTEDGYERDLTSKSVNDQVQSEGDG
ncbi:hypothetical protein FXO38_22170 [Capsicum annuum]|nr:hypothetical protein FXO37_32979 [Capsicum annuum]KAF3640347.1 hypothetical protein FXO38_22170 [Capsicum annuum]